MYKKMRSKTKYFSLFDVLKELFNLNRGLRSEKHFQSCFSFKKVDFL